jgi:xanthine dehydrogenase YagS FAD-binding subunit
MMPSFSYARPQSLEDAMGRLQSAGAYPHAGGTDLLGCLRDGVFEASTVVSLRDLRALHGVEQRRDGRWRIGAMTTIATIAEHPQISERYPGLAQAAGEVASPQLRHQGTIGGNLCQKPRCWYYRGDYHCVRKGGDRCYAYEGRNEMHCIFGGSQCFIVHPSDTAPALIALAAEVRTRRLQDERTMAVEELFVSPEDDPTRETVLEPDEIIMEVILPASSANLRSSYRKIRARQAWDFALAGLALSVDMDGDRVRSARAVLSGVAPVPWRSRAIEEAITGKRLDDAVIARAAAAAVRKADPLEHNRYKVDLVRGMVEEELSAIR